MKKIPPSPSQEGNTPPCPSQEGTHPLAPLKRGVSQSPLYRGDLGVCLFNSPFSKGGMRGIFP